MPVIFVLDLEAQMASSISVRLAVVALDRQKFLKDPHARRYSTVVDDAWLEFFSDPLRQLRLLDAQLHHGRPALAGVVRELESHQAFRMLSTQAPSKTRHHRQCIGVIVKQIMSELGWKTTGIKGSLAGLSGYFSRSEMYTK